MCYKDSVVSPSYLNLLDFIKIPAILELWFSTSEVKTTVKGNEIKTIMCFAEVIIWFMYLARGMIFLTHCVKSIQIRSLFWSVFSCIQTRKNFVYLRPFSRH